MRTNCLTTGSSSCASALGSFYSAVHAVQRNASKENLVKCCQKIYKFVHKYRWEIASIAMAAATCYLSPGWFVAGAIFGVTIDSLMCKTLALSSYRRKISMDRMLFIQAIALGGLASGVSLGLSGGAAAMLLLFAKIEQISPNISRMAS
jgi:hypothetical protein